MLIITKGFQMSFSNEQKAILVLESPWSLDDSDSNRTSVLPFVEGIGKLAGNTHVYHANFYDKSSFKKALDCLCKIPYDSTIIYIAAHGYKKKIGGVHIDDVIFEIADKSRIYNITGIHLGSCHVGENTINMEAFIQDSNLVWCSGFASTTKWFEGTLIDCAILNQMAQQETFTNREDIVESLAAAIAPFNPNYHIGDNYHGDAICIEDSIQFVVQPHGKGFKALTVSEDVLLKSQDELLYEIEEEDFA
jgi:hypothetical protein